MRIEEEACGPVASMVVDIDHKWDFAARTQQPDDQDGIVEEAVAAVVLAASVVPGMRDETIRVGAFRHKLRRSLAHGCIVGEHTRQVAKDWRERVGRVPR